MRNQESLGDGSYRALRIQALTILIVDSDRNNVAVIKQDLIFLFEERTESALM